MMGPGARRAIAAVGLMVLCLAAFVVNLGACGIFDLDEGLYSSVAREMRLTGDYVTPRVNGQPFFEKPPLVYWASAACFSVFGRSEMAARLPSAFAAMAVTLLVLLLGTAWFGRRSGYLAAAFYAASPLVFGTSRLMTMDAQLTLWLACAVVCFFHATRLDAAHPDRWAIGFWAACALGTLTKGVVALVLPLAIGFIYLLLLRRKGHGGFRQGIARLRPALGFAVFLAIALPWHVAAWRASGEAFVREYLIRQHVGRFLGGDTAHLAPPWFFVPVLLIGAFPGSLFLVQGLATRVDRGSVTGESSARLLLKVWFWVLFAFFSVSGSKLVSYILPLFPAAALLSGDWCARAVRDVRMRRGFVVALACGLCLTGFLLTVLLLRDPLIAAIQARSTRPVRIDAATRALLEIGCWLYGSLAAGCAVALALAATGRRGLASAALLVGAGMFVIIGAVRLPPVLDRAYLSPLHALVKSAGERAAAGAPLMLCVGPPSRPSAVFYLPDRVLLRGPSRGLRVPADSGAEPAAAFLLEHPGGLVLTDGHVADDLAVSGCAVVTERRGPFAVVTGRR